MLSNLLSYKPKTDMRIGFEKKPLSNLYRKSNERSV